MCTNKPTATKWKLTLSSSTSYSPDSLLELRFSGSADFTGLLVVVDHGSFPYAMLPKYLKPGLCAPLASVTHVDADPKAANFTLSWLAPPPGAGQIRFVAMVFGSRSGKNCDYYGADLVLSEGPATPRPTPPPTPPPAPTPPTTATPRPASTAPIPTPPTRPVLTGDVVIYPRHSVLRLVTYDPGDLWDRLSFVDMHWRPATAPIGFGYPVADFNTTAFGASLRAPLADVFVRTHFELLAEQVAAVKSAVLKLAVDDSADIIVNELVLDTSASLSKVFTAKYWTQTIDVPISALRVGDNLIAAHIVNIETTSTLLFDLELVLSYDATTTSTPPRSDGPAGATTTTAPTASQSVGGTVGDSGNPSSPGASAAMSTALDNKTPADISPAASATMAVLTIIAFIIASIALH
jgi:hypothetical protein